MSKTKSKKPDTTQAAIDVTPRSPGRPAESVNRDYDIVDVQPSACRCGSTERTPYEGRPQEFEQRHADVIRVTIWRRTKCLACGQHRKDRSQRKRALPE